MKKIAIAIISLVVGVAGMARAAVELTPVHIEETRSASMTDDKIGRMPDQLKIIFALKGPEVDSAVKYGELKLDEAVDDQGTNLIPEKNVFNDTTKFKEFSNAFFRKNDGETKRPPEIEFILGISKRSATKIARLRGSLSLASEGTIKTIELGGLKKPGETKMDIPAEAGMGITVNVKPDEHNEVRSIGLEISGDENALESIEVDDASGKKISNGMSSWSMGGGPVHRSLDLDKPADDSMKLVVKFAVDRKITKVPVDFKDIVLP